MCLGGWGTGCSWEEASRSGHSHWTLNREAQVITWGGGAEESDQISSVGGFVLKLNQRFKDRPEVGP